MHRLRLLGNTRQWHLQYEGEVQLWASGWRTVVQDSCRVVFGQQSVCHSLPRGPRHLNALVYTWCSVYVTDYALYGLLYSSCFLRTFIRWICSARLSTSRGSLWDVVLDLCFRRTTSTAQQTVENWPYLLMFTLMGLTLLSCYCQPNSDCNGVFSSRTANLSYDSRHKVKVEGKFW